MRSTYSRLSSRLVDRADAERPPTMLAHKNPIFKNANGEFLTRQLRLELDRPQRIKQSCTKRVTSILQSELSEAVKRKIRNAKSGRKPRRRSNILTGFAHNNNQTQLCMHIAH